MQYQANKFKFKLTHYLETLILILMLLNNLQALQLLSYILQTSGTKSTVALTISYHQLWFLIG